MLRRLVRELFGKRLSSEADGERHTRPEGESAKTFFEHGNRLSNERRLDEAVTAYSQALALNPDHAEAYNNLGLALQAQGKIREAVECYNKAIALKPDLAQPHVNLGNVLHKMEQLDLALQQYQTAVRLAPESREAHMNLGSVLQDMGRIDEAVASYEKAIALDPNFAVARSNLLFALNYSPSMNAQAVYQAHLRWAEEVAAPLAGPIRAHRNNCDPERRLRIGYVSPDFKKHAVAYFIEPILANHNHEWFAVICYDNGLSPDHVTGRLKSFADEWRNIATLSDAQAAELVRRDEIDILIDLAGHTANNRMLLFARKPAPVQVTYLGYPTTTGLATMDYRITDGFADPIIMTEQYYSERLLRLPDSMWCYRLPEDMPEVGPLPALTNGYIMFGSFNNVAKITPQVLALWSRLLLVVPESRLVMVTVAAGETQRRLLAAFGENGIAPERLELFAKLPRDEFARMHHRVDVALDPFPCNGGTTTCESLWMGVPVITLTGQSFVSRAGFSLLSNLGLTELIAHTPEEYVAIGVWIAADLERLAEMRREMRGRMQRSPLTDAARFTRNLEAAYREIWRSWCRKQIAGGVR